MPYTEKRGDGEFPWRVRWKAPDGTWPSASGFASDEAADDYGREQEAAIRAGRWTDPRKASTPFGDWAEAWMAAQVCSSVTAAKRRRYLKRILEQFAETPIREVNRFAVKTWAARVPLAASTVGQMISLISTILTAAYDADMLEANPLYKMQFTPTNAQKRRAKVASDGERVWAYPELAVELGARLSPANSLLAITAAFTGMRWGELVGLHRDNCCLLRGDRIDGKVWIRRVIRIDPDVGALHETTELDEDGHERVVLYLGEPKPPSGAREADLPDFLAELLAEHLANWPYDYVFTTPSGAFWRRGNWSKIWRPVCDGRPAAPTVRGHAAREAWEPLAPGLDLHGLRHGHKTAMEEDGIADNLQDEQMGHKKEPDRREVRKRYAHITGPMRQQRLNALTERWEKAGGLWLKAA